MRNLIRSILVLALLALLGAGVWQARWLARRHSAPGPAANAPPATPATPARILAEGRLEARPGARVTVSSEVAGLLTNLTVRETSTVRAGDLLGEIQADDVHAALLEARARVVELESDIALASSDLRRARGLADTAAITAQELERLSRQCETLQARQNTARVTVQRLETTLAKTRILAPIGGVVLARHVHPGEVVDSGTPLLVLADLERTWIEAEVDEYDAPHVRPGARVTVRAEGHDTVWTGQVEEIPNQVAPRALLPQDPARPSDVRVLSVKVGLAGPTPLKLGQRVEVEIALETAAP